MLPKIDFGVYIVGKSDFKIVVCYNLIEEKKSPKLVREPFLLYYS